MLFVAVKPLFFNLIPIYTFSNKCSRSQTETTPSKLSSSNSLTDAKIWQKSSPNISRTGPQFLNLSSASSKVLGNVEIYSPAESNLDSFTENVNVIENRLITTMSLDTYLANAIREIKTLENYKEIGVTDIVLDGYPGKRVEYTINYPTDAGDIINLHMIQFLTIASASENAYIVTCTLQKNSRPAFTEQCDQIAKSLKLHTTQIN